MTISDRNRLRHKQDKIIKYAIAHNGRDFGRLALSSEYHDSPTMADLMENLFPSWESVMDKIISELGIG